MVKLHGQTIPFAQSVAHLAYRDVHRAFEHPNLLVHSRVARASSSSTCEIAKPTWIRTQSPGPTLVPFTSSRPTFITAS